MTGSSRALVVWCGAVAVVSFVLLSTSCVPTWAQASCETNYVLPNGTLKTYSRCQSLQVQGAVIAWNFFPGANSSNGTATGGILDLVCTNTLLDAGGWAGWGLNPYTTGAMVGSSVLVAFTDSSNGSAVLLPYLLTSQLLSNAVLQSSSNNLDVLDKAVEINPTTLLASIYAKILLQPGQNPIYQVWNKGSSVTGLSPNRHDINDYEYLESYSSLDVTTGTVTVVARPNQKLKEKHGLINAIAWGILFPLGVLSARYMRPFAVFDPLWFYVHVTCQCSGYILGVTGWAIGIKITDKANVKYKHRNIGISLFVLATLQVLALVLRPKPDHKVRKYWNVWHHCVGYSILVLSVVNIFKGLDLLKPAKGWKHAYIGVLIALAAIALVLEIFTWIVWYLKKSRTPERLEDGNKVGDAHSGNGVMKGVHDNDGSEAFNTH